MADSNIAVSRQIMRQIGSETNKRFLRNMPVFRAVNDTPSLWKDLLDRMDRAERQAANCRVALKSGRA